MAAHTRRMPRNGLLRVIVGCAAVVAVLLALTGRFDSVLLPLIPEHIMGKRFPEEKPPSAARGTVHIVAKGPDWEHPVGEVKGKLPGDFELVHGIEWSHGAMWRADGECLTNVSVDVEDIREGDRDAAVKEFVDDETRYAVERGGSFRPRILARAKDRTVVSAPNGQVDPEPGDRPRMVFLDVGPGQFAVIYVHGSVHERRNDFDPSKPCKDPNAGQFLDEMTEIVNRLSRTLQYRPLGS